MTPENIQRHAGVARSLYVLPQWREDEPITFAVEGFDGGSVSMLGIRLG
jgi:hypothetical protein